MATPTVTVTATLNDPSGSALQGNSFLRFRLRGFQGFPVQVSTFAILGETQIDSLPTTLGAISQAIVPNDDISPSSTYYTVEAWDQGRIIWSANYIFNADTNLNTASPINTPPVPPGFSLVLENNGVLNSSQSTLNLESTDSSVLITDEGGGTLNLSAAGAIGNAAFPMPQMNGEDGGLAGYTMVMRIPGTMLTATGDGLIVSVMTGSNLSTGWVVTGASVAASLNSYFIPGVLSSDPSIPWTTAPVAMTFPAGAFATPSTVYRSNPVAITVDPQHTYYIALHFDSSSAGNVPIANWSSAGAIPQFWVDLFGYISGDHTNDSDSTAFGSLSGSGNLHAFVNVEIA